MVSGVRVRTMTVLRYRITTAISAALSMLGRTHGTRVGSAGVSSPTTSTLVPGGQGNTAIRCRGAAAPGQIFFRGTT